MTDPTEPRDDQEMTLEGRLARLEEILVRMEAEDVPLDEAMRLFEEGVAHVRQAESVLSETELRVEELLSSGETRPLDLDDS